MPMTVADNELLRRVVDGTLVRPTTGDETARLREGVKLLLTAAQADLGDRNVKINGRRMNDHEYWTWHARRKQEVMKLQSALGLIKQWYQEIRDEENQAKLQLRIQTAADVGTVTSLRKEVFTKFHDLCSMMANLEKRLVELTEENNALREKLGRMEAAALGVGARTAGDPGHDAWRDAADQPLNGTENN
jgi:septal ring factor EnvC (AmiA/AmiB activator)